MYTERDLRHKMLVLMEVAGLSGDFQEYVIRVLLSEGFLEYEVTEKTQDGLKNVVVRKEGPTGFITTTTRDELHAKNETRYLSITVTDTREQRSLAEEGAEELDRGRWHALQTWLEGGEHRATIPCAGTLAEKMGDVAVRLRRDFSVVLSLVKAHAILHGATREVPSPLLRLGAPSCPACPRVHARIVYEGGRRTIPSCVGSPGLVRCTHGSAGTGEGRAGAVREGLRGVDRGRSGVGCSGDREGRNVSDNYREYPWSRKGEPHDEMISEEPFDEDEEFDPEEAERRITQFVTSADELPGPPVEELAEQVAALMRTALRDLEMIMTQAPHNKVLATQLMLGQRARKLQQQDPEQWPLHAATSLLSGLVIRGAES